MRKIFTLILAFTFIFGGLANAQQLKSIAKAKASVNAVANTNAEIGAFKMNGEKPAEKPATGKQVKLNSLLGSGAKATTVYSEDFTGGMGGWTVVGLGDGSWSVKDESNAGGTAPELMLEWVSGSDFDGQSYCMSPVINTTGYTTLALEFKQWFRNYQGSSVLGVYTTIDDGATWEEVWSETVSANFVEVKNLLITNAHVGNANFRIAFGFNGNTFDIWEWAIDDILLVEPDAHDLAIVAINLNTFVESGSTVTPQVTIRNMGISNEATWSLTLTDGDAYTSTKSDILINIGDNLVVDMDDWTPADGQYTLTATLTLTDDANTSNNTLTATVDVIEFSTAFAWNAYHEGGLNATGEGPVNIVLQSGVMTQIAVDDSDFIAAADYVGLEIYGIRYADGVPCPLVKIDPVTGVVTNIGGGAVDLVGFTYDVTTETAYVIDFNGMLGTINLETGEVTNIGGDYTSVIGLACDVNGNLIAISLSDHIASIDKTTGTSTIIGNLGVNISYAQDICYDRDNNILYGALYTDQGAIYIINTTTGAATLVSEVIDELTGFAIPYTLVGPQVVSLTPEVNAIDVAIDAAVSVTFDVNLTEVDLAGITITPDPGNVSASINNAVLTIAHDDFAYNTTYTVLVPAGAVSDGVDATTHPITWSFKTMLDPAACNTPTNLVVSNIQETEATVAWTETGAGTQWRVKYGATGFDPDTEGLEKVVDVQTATITELTGNTTYEVYVQAICPGDETSGWAGPASFTTDCGIATSLDEGFEDAVPPLCWITFQAGAGTKTWQQNTSVYLEGVASAAASWESSGGENQQWLVTGRITVPTSHNLTFYARDYLSSEYNSVLRIMISTDADPNNTGAYTQLLELAESDVNSSSFTKFDVNLSSYAGQDVFIAFVMVDNNGDRWYLDVVKLEPRVPVVVSLTPEADAVDVALDAAVSVTFDVDITAVDLTGITITPDPGNVSASVNNAVLTIAHDDFTYNTTYTVLVPAGAVSDGITPTTGLVTWSFKTMLDPALCNTPTNLVVSNVLENEATVTWTEVGAGTQWRVKYGATGFNPETEGEEVVVNEQTATITELTANTTYEVYVQALCPGDATSDWAGPASFTTACAAITTLPYLEEFEGAFPIECWTFVNNHADPTSNWHIDNDPDTGDPALNILWSDENMMDEWAISPVFDLSGITGEIALTFDFLMSYEYQVDPTNGADVMVKVTTDNGTTWTKIWQEEDYGTFENWTWYTATLPFSTYVGESNVKFAFHYLGNDGAQVMIDNVELDYATSVNDNVTNLVSVYPNPSNGIVNVQVSETSVITIVDLAGRVVATYNANANETLSFTQAAGVYVVKVESNGQVSNHKLIIQ